MAGIEKKKGGGYLIRLSAGEDENRRRISFGKINKRQADQAKACIENIIRAKNTNSELSAITQNWINDLKPAVRRRLERLGLIDKQKGRDSITLKLWFNRYIENRSDLKESTKDRLRTVRDNLFNFCNNGMPIEDFTGYDAEEFRRYLLDNGLAENTVRRRCKRVKQFFAAALKKRIVTDNPFDGIPTNMISNNSRLEFITAETIEQAIEACPNNSWRLIFALARYGGLRIPSELVGLTWDNVLWDKKRFIVFSPKKEHLGQDKATRVVPIFPELEPYLMAAFEAAKDGQRHIFENLDSRSNLRTQAHRIIRKAGLKPWGKLFQNLRSSRETELVETFPVHVVTQWLGNSPDVAKKHYLQTHEEHYKKAVQGGGPNKGLNSPKGGLNKGLKSAANYCKDSQEENINLDFQPVIAGFCDDLQDNSTSYNSPRPPRVGFEPTT